MPSITHSSTRRRVPRSALALLAAVFSLSTIGISGAEASSVHKKNPTTPETNSVTYPLTGVSAGSGSIVFSATQNIFAKYGLTVTTPASSEGPVKDGIVAGTFPIEGVAGSDVLDLQGHGYKVSMVACAVGTSPASGFHIIVPASIATVAQIPRNASIGVPSLLGAPQLAMDRFLSTNGWTLQEIDSANYVPLGSIPAVLAALESGQIQVAPLSSPFYLQAESKGFKQLGVGISPPTPVTVQRSWAKSHPHTITAFLEGYIDGAWDYYTHPSAALPVLANFLGDSLSVPAQAALVQAGYSQYLPPVGGIMGQCHPQYYQPYLKFLSAQDQKKINLKTIINNSYVNAIKATGFYRQIEKQYGPLQGLNPWILGN